MSNKVPLSAMPDYYTSGLQDFLGNLGEAVATINLVELSTAVNAKTESEKFKKLALQGRYIDPCFQYNTELLGKVAGLRSTVLELWEKMPTVLSELSNEEPGRVLAEMTRARCYEAYQATCVAVAFLDHDSRTASERLERIFGFPSDEIIRKAYAHANDLANGTGTVRDDTPERKARRQALKALEFDAEKIRETFLWAAEQCGFAGSRPVKIDPLATAIDVRDKSSQGAVVVIPETRKVNGVKLVELTQHEVLCHWGDSTRAGISLPFLGSGNLKPSDERLYEGHAVMADFNTHVNLGENAPLRQTPWYIIAMDLAKAGLSFGEMAQRLYDFVRPTTETNEAAWNTVWTACYRVKRGFSGSDCTGIFTKDRAYFEGRIKAEELCMNGLGNVLEIATISVADLELLLPVVDFGEDLGLGSPHQAQVLREQLCEKLLAE